MRVARRRLCTHARAAPTPAACAVSMRVARRCLCTHARAAPTPGLCAVQLATKLNRRNDLVQWLGEGRALLGKTLRKEGTATAHVVGTDVRSSHLWVHLPAADAAAADAAAANDTVAIIFTDDADLASWRASPQRAEWLASGVARGLARDESSVLVEASHIPLVRDDGSLGGWLPSEEEEVSHGSGAASAAIKPLPPPPAWKVAATVLIAMYPTQEANRLAILPLLASQPSWASLPDAVQVFLTCGWTCGLVTVVLLPLARSHVESLGFIGGARGCPGPTALASATGQVMLIYAGLVACGLGAAALAGTGRAKDVCGPRQGHIEIPK